MLRNKIIRFLIGLLSYTPITTVATAAQIKCNELDSILQNEKLKNKILETRKKILEKNQSEASIQESYQRYVNLQQSYNEVVSIESINIAFLKNLEFLIENGYIAIDEKEIRAIGPSEHAL